MKVSKFRDMTNIELDQDYMNITTIMDEQPQYVTGMQSYTVQYEIRLMGDILSELESPKKKPKKTEIKKDIVQGPFAFLNIKED